jgi:hypothetical protein
MREPRCVLEMFEAGIKKEYIIPYNPQQNGVTERKNISTFTYVYVGRGIHDCSVCSEHKSLRNMTHEEAFTRVKPEVGRFRIFGCSVYIHVPKEKRTKLDPSGRKGTFVGYNESLKEYRIYIPGQRQIE